MWCVLAERVGDLLAGPDGHIPDQLAPLQAALTDTDRPDAVIRWLSKGPACRLLATLAGDPEALTHDLLDQFAPAKPVHYLRDVLVLAGVLEPRDEYLERLGVWLRELLAELPAAHLRLLGPFAQWNVLHRARRRSRQYGPRSAGAASGSRKLILAAARFLNWLDENTLDLATINQQHLDRWLSTGPGAGDLRKFIQWTNQRELTSGLTVPIRRRSLPDRFLAEDQRWTQLRRCLHDATMPLKVRVAGSLVLLLGIPASRVLGLTLDDITNDQGDISLRFGKQPLRLPPRLADLVTQLAAQPAQASSLRPAPNGVLHLFPGRPPTRPLNPQAFSKTLNQHGITPHPGRNAALVDLAADLPAAVLADLLGLHPSTAVKWSTITGSDWASYLQARADEDTATDCPPPQRNTTQPE